MNQRRKEKAQRSKGAPFWKRDWFIGLILALVTLLAYRPAWNGTPVWDDDVHITRPEMRSVEGLSRIWFEPGATQQYYPIVHSTFWVAHKLWGDAPLGYHLLNVLLHIGAALLLARILRHLEVPGAWLAAGIFALHPVQVESVAWLSELKNTLSGICYLGAALAYLQFAQRRKWSSYAIALALFLIGLGAKTVIASLPAALLLVFWWKGGTASWKRNVAPIFPFLLVGIVAGLFTAWMERKFIGAHGVEFTFTLLDRCLIAGRAFWFYLGKLFWPAELIFIYPRWNINPAQSWQYLFPAAALLLLGIFWSMRKRSRAPLTVLLFFTGTLLPALGFLNVYPFRYSFVADHFQYLASIGPITLVSAGLCTVLGRVNQRKSLILAIAFCVSLGVLTWRQAAVYRDMETLWRFVIAKNPGGWLAHNNLGIALLRTGHEEEAFTHFRQAVELNPAFPEAQNNLGNRLSRLGRGEEAIAHLQKALKLNPAYAEAHNNLGITLLQTGRPEEAIASYRRALEIDPAYAEAHNNLGNALQYSGQAEEAAAYFRRAIEIKPDYVDPHYNLGNDLLQQGRVEDAIAQYKKALEIDSQHVPALINLGALYLQRGRVDESRTHLETALAIDPKNADVRNNLGNTLLRLGRVEEATVQFQGALEIDPSNVSAANNLAWLYATSPEPRVRNGAKAVEIAERADHLTASANPVIKATLAAALAESGRFEEAVQAAERALELASNSANSVLANAIGEQIELYRNRQPSRENSYR